MNKKQARILIKIILRALVLLIIIIGIGTLFYIQVIMPKQIDKTFDNPEFKEQIRKSKAIESSLEVVYYEGVSFKLPLNWKSKENSNYDGQAHQIHLKKNESSLYIGQFVVFMDLPLDYQEIDGEIMDFEDLINNYKIESSIERFNIVSIKKSKFSGVKCGVLNYTFNQVGDETNMFGRIYQFIYKNRFFVIDQKSDKKKDPIFSIMESSFTVDE